jgi:hypothetical protein
VSSDSTAPSYWGKLIILGVENPIVQPILVQVIQRADEDNDWLSEGYYPDAPFEFTTRNGLEKGFGRILTWACHGTPTIERLYVVMRASRHYILPVRITASLGYPYTGRDDGVMDISNDQVKSHYTIPFTQNSC